MEDWLKTAKFQSDSYSSNSKKLNLGSKAPEADKFASDRPFYKFMGSVSKKKALSKLEIVTPVRTYVRKESEESAQLQCTFSLSLSYPMLNKAVPVPTLSEWGVIFEDIKVGFISSNTCCTAAAQLEWEEENPKMLNSLSFGEKGCKKFAIF